ncbi:MAG: outer membrane protein assembly factor BamC [Pseudomonadota bacterium]
MKRVFSAALVLFVVSSGTGCSWLEKQQWVRDRGDDYRKARVEPRIVVPAHLEDDSLQDIYVIPQVSEQVRLTEKFSVPRPTPLVARESEELVRIQRLGDEEWVLASVAPGQLWPQVRAFLSTGGLQVARVDARAGLIETGWFQTEGASMNERYRFRIEQGVQRNTSELHVKQMYQAGDIESWPEQSADKERGSQMLLAVAQYIASAAEAPVSLMAQQSMGDGGKVSMREGEGGAPYIELKLPYYRAWASVDRALRQSNFSVRDLDRSSGLFYISFVPPEEDDGWFGWLFDGDEEENEFANKDYLLKLVDEGGEQVRISLGMEDGSLLALDQQQQLLSLLKGNIN